MHNERFDVVIAGAGLAGLSLARQLLLYTDKTVLLLDKLEDPPGKSQKVGESLVQLAGYYFSKTLDLEEYLLINHYLKYNLRFYWKTGAGKNDFWEDVSSSSIRSVSNLETFQLDRNELERHLLKINRESPRFRFLGGVRNIKIGLSENGEEHRVSFDGGEARGRWVVDASGRTGILKRSMSLQKQNPIRHGATWCWVEGLVNYEKLTRLSHSQMLRRPERRQLGSFPFFLATSHFCGEGRWFWVIPLHGKTSLGLVYEHAVIRPEEVPNARKMIDWVCRDWPLFAEDLPKRKILDEGRLMDYSHDAKQTISSARWAITGVAGRFTDPLYSPGSDLISIYNTLIMDAIQTEDPAALESKCEFFEQIMRVMYESYVPSYDLSYNCLGDQEAFTLKYTFELAVYFGFFVFPFTNQLFTNRAFMRSFLRKFAFFGPVNKNLHMFLREFFIWKKKNGPAAQTGPVHIEFYDLEPLRLSEKMFYEIGLTVEEAEEAIEKHAERIKEFARYILAHVHAVVVGDRRALLNAPFIASLRLRDTVFDPERMREAWAKHADSEEVYRWNLNPFVLESFIPEKTVDQAERTTA
jgi:flavin-dependent dehydrogenase